MKKLEEVFKRSGIPTYTFVEPVEYNSLLVSIRTPGRGTIVEGPSGIGKTTSVLRIIESLANGKSVTRLSGRNPDDYDLITALPEMGEEKNIRKGFGLSLNQTNLRSDLARKP